MFSIRPRHSNWFCRLALILLIASMSYVVSRQSYNFAHWVPHNLLRQMGFSYNNLLWLEQNGNYFLHFFGAFMLTFLLSGAHIRYLSTPKIRPFLLVTLLCFGAEALQFLIGRGVESSDLLLGILGGFVAYLAIDKNN